jgi:hypothetical protein
LSAIAAFSRNKDLYRIASCVGGAKSIAPQVSRIAVRELQKAPLEPKTAAEVPHARERVSAELGFVTFAETIREAVHGKALNITSTNATAAPAI